MKNVSFNFFIIFLLFKVFGGFISGSGDVPQRAITFLATPIAAAEILLEYGQHMGVCPAVYTNIMMLYNGWVCTVVWIFVLFFRVHQKNFMLSIRK